MSSCFEELLSSLSDDEKKEVPDNLQKKIGEFCLVKEGELDQLKVENEKCKTDYDQQKFQLEREVVSLREQLEIEGREKANAQLKLKTHGDDNVSLNKELQEVTARNASLLKDIETIRNEQESASTQSMALAGNLEARNKLMDELKLQVQSLNKKLVVAIREKCEAVIHAEEAASRQIQNEYKERRLEQERNLLNRQMELIQQQLEQRTEEAFCQRRDHSNSMLTLQTDLRHKIEEVRVLKDEHDHFQRQLDEKTHRIEELLDTLNSQRESDAKLEETLRQEVSSQKNLAGIYKRAMDDQDERIVVFEKSVEEMQQLLRDSSDQYGVLEAAKNKVEEELNEKLDNANLYISELKQEIDKVNTLLESNTKKDPKGLADLSPAASAATQLMKKGLTLSQLYGEYLVACEKKTEAEQESKRVNRYLEQVLQEIESRAPVLRKQRDDYEQAMTTINSLHARLDDSLAELEKQRISSEEAQRRSSYLTRENGRINHQVKDLNRQVTVLLTQVEAARTGQPPPPIHSIERRLSGNTTANDIISQKLVIFRDVSELQEQNQKLLTNLRELSDKIEEAEFSAVETRTQEIQDELDAAKIELEELKTARDRQEVLVTSITRQRDTYRSLAQQSSKEKLESGQTPPSPRTPGSMQQSTPVKDKLQDELTEAKKSIESLKKNHDNYCTEKSKNDKLVQEEMNRLKTTNEKITSNNIKMLSQAEYNQERLKTMQASCETLQRQVNSLEENNKTLNGIIGRHEGSIESLRGEMLKLTKKLSHAEITAANVREEKTLLKESNARLLSERENNSRNKISHDLVLSNLELIKNNLERSDSDSKMRHENQISDLSEQVIRLKTKMESNVELKELEAKYKSTEEQVKAVREQHNACRSQLNNTQAELAAKKLELEEFQKPAKVPIGTPVARGRGRVSPGGSVIRIGGSPSPALMRDLQVQLNEERAKVANLTKTNEDFKKNCDQLKQLNEQLEKQIKSTTEASQVGQSKMEQIEAARQVLTDELKQMEQEMEENVDASNALEEALQSQLYKIREDFAASQVQLEAATNELDDAKAASAKAKREADESTSSAANAQEKYEREVMLHGADLTAMAALKEKLSNHNQQFEEISTAKIKAEEALRETRLGFEERENIIRQESKDLVERTHELEEQNKSLLEQFTTLSDKMASIQSKLTDVGKEGTNTSFTEDEARSSDQLREVMKYLRRERDVSMGKCEVAQAESSRITIQKKALDNKVQQLTTQLTDERERTQVSLDTAGRYGELLRKVQTMDALADSNRLLREEKEELQINLDEKKIKLQSIESQIGPIQKQLREATNKYEHLIMDKKSLESEKEMYKKRTQELVEKLNRAKPEDLLRLQHEQVTLKKSIQIKDAELNRAKNQVNQAQKTNQMVTSARNQMQLQNNSLEQNLVLAQEDAKRAADESKKLTQEKIRQQQQLVELRQKEAKESENKKREIEMHEKKFEKTESQLHEYVKKTEHLETRIGQLRRIATKYKKAADSSGAGLGADEETGDKIKELEETINNLKQQIDSAPTRQQVTDLEEELSTLKQQLTEKEAEINKIKLQEKETIEVSESKERELVIASTNFNVLKKSKEEINKRLEECEKGKKSCDNKLIQNEKERDALLADIESMNKKLQMQQRLLENLQKQASGKPSTSGVTSEKISTDPPPTANIKPMAAPVATISSPRSQTATQVVTPSRTIPTASIRPLAPPTSGQLQGQGSSVGVVSPLESYSEGTVSSTVTLPQATVTPTPATPTPTQPTSSTTTLTATVSPTPATISSPAVSAFPLQSSVQVSVPTTMSTASPIQSASGPQPSTSAQVASVSPSTQPSASVTPTQSQAAIVATVAPQEQQQKQEPTRESSSAASADALISQAIAMITPRVDQSQPNVEESSEVSQPGSINKRKRNTDDENVDEETKRKCVVAAEQEAAVGPSSSNEADVPLRPKQSQTDVDEDVIFVESDSDEQQSRRDGNDSDDIEAMNRDNDDEMEQDDGRECNSSSHARKQPIEGREAEAGDSGSTMEAIAQARQEDDSPEAPSESTQSVSQSQQPQPSSGLSQATSTQPCVVSSAPIRGGLRSPLRRGPPLRPEHASTGRQSLAPFSQLAQFEEIGEDSIVPSTPTLYKPRRDGFSEAVSSPQVPSSGFVFAGSSESPNTSGLTQLAEGGLIDDTRMDIGQLEESGNARSISTPPQRPSHELSSEAGVSTSGSASSSGEGNVAVTVIPDDDDDDDRTSRHKFTEADSVAAEVGQVDDDDEEEEDDDDDDDEQHQDMQQEQDEDLEEDEDSNDQVGPVVTTANLSDPEDVEEVDEIEEDIEDEEEEEDDDEDEHGSQEVDDGASGDQATSSSSGSPRRITPITWGGADSGRPSRGRGNFVTRPESATLGSSDETSSSRGGVSARPRGGTARRARPAFKGP